MNYGKPAMLVGALTILASTLAFEWAAFSEAKIADQVAPIALIAGLLGLAIWLTGCVKICRTLSAPSLFGFGVAMLIVLFLGGSLLDHLSPAVTNVHIGMGGLMAPMAACFLGGLMFILLGIVRLGAH
jgi:hypothetical protein